MCRLWIDGHRSWCRWWQGLLNEPLEVLEDIIMPLAVPPKVHGHLTVVENMRQRLSILLTKGTSVLGLLAPGMEDRIGRKGIERGIQGKLEWLRW